MPGHTWGVPMTVRDMQHCPGCGTSVVAKADGTCPACQCVLFHAESPPSEELPEPSTFAKSAPPSSTVSGSAQALYDDVFSWRRLWQSLCIGGLCLLAVFVVMNLFVIPNRHSADRPAAVMMMRGMVALAQVACYILVVICAIGWILCGPRLTTDVQPINAGGPYCRSATKQALMIPASALLLLSVVSAAIDLVIMCHELFNDSKGAVIAAMGLMLSMHLFIMFGAIQMFKLKRYSIAWLTGGLSVIPYCSPVVILGIPFGLWALLKLSDRQVMNTFVLNSVDSSIELQTEEASSIATDEHQAEDSGSTATSELHRELCPYCENTVIPSIDGRCPECRRPIA